MVRKLEYSRDCDRDAYALDLRDTTPPTEQVKCPGQLYDAQSSLLCRVTGQLQDQMQVKVNPSDVTYRRAARQEDGGFRGLGYFLRVGIMYYTMIKCVSERIWLV